VLQGIFLSIEAILNKRRTKIESTYKLKSNFAYVTFFIILTYVLFSISQVFGRAVTFEDSVLVFEKAIFERGPLFLDKTTLAYSLIGVIMLLLSDFRDEYFSGKLLLFDNKYFPIRLLSYLFVSLLILWIGILNGGQFIYFKF